MMRKTTAMKTKTRTAAKTATWEKRAGEKFDRETISTPLQQHQTVLYNRIQDNITLCYAIVLLKYTQVVCIRRSRARRPAEFVASQRTAVRDERVCRVSELCTCTGETHIRYNVCSPPMVSH